MCLFFYETAYSEKKNSSCVKGGGKKIYKEINKTQNTESRDIISKKRSIRNNFIKENDDPDDLAKDDSVKSGEKSKIKSTGYKYYIVKKGDTLYSIAKRSSMSLKQILEINSLDANSPIYTGMKLKIPCRKAAGINTVNSSGKEALKAKPNFLWPMKKVRSYDNDGKDGVKSIGIIIKGNPCSEVIASEKGIVKRVGYMRGYGKYVVLHHENRYMTVYSNLMDVNVRVGETVQRGKNIGSISNDMTLHFQIDYQGKPENPLKLLPDKG